MLTLFASFERIGGDVDADVLAGAYVFGDQDVDTAHDVGDTGEQYADALTQAEILGTNQHAESSIEQTAVHIVPIGASTIHAQAYVFGEMGGNAQDSTSIGDPAARAEASGDVISYGRYDIVDLPENDAVYRGRWKIQGFGDGSEQDQYNYGSAGSSHYTEIVTQRDGFLPFVWYVSATALATNEWYVTYDLPVLGVGSYTINGTLDIEYTQEWAYDLADEVQANASMSAYGGARVDVGEASFYGSGYSEASLYLIDNTFDFGEPPKVSNVIIDSTVSNPYGTNPPYKFSDVDGSEEQLRTVPVGGANRIAIQFTEDVSILSGDLDLIALNRVVTEPSVVSFVPPDLSNNFTATWTLAAALPGAQYLIRLDDTITDADGQALDGEWTNPSTITSSLVTSQFPSGNHLAGGDFEFVFTYMPGDANRDLRVSITDHGILSSNYNQNNKSWAQGDFTGDGSVTVSDLGLLGTYYNFDWRTLAILGDYDGDWDLDTADQTAFTTYYNSSDLNADLNKDGQLTQADIDAFDALFDFGIDLDVA